jgi:hypothetical protein
VHVACGALRVILRSEAPRLSEDFATAIDDLPVVVVAVVSIGAKRWRRRL